MRSSRVVVVLAALALGTGCAARSKAFIFPELAPCDPGSGPTERLRVVSFNIKSGLLSSMEKVGAVLAELRPDVVALQEVDVGVSRTERVDQARVLAERLGMQYVFAGAIVRGGGDYGVALLSRLPITRAERVDLSASVAFEPRVAIDATVCANGEPVRVVTVHADVFPWSSAANSRALARALGPMGEAKVIVAGDLNATPQEESPRLFVNAGLVDVLGAHRVGATFRGTSRRLDYILVDPPLDLGVAEAGALESDASDHIPVYAEFTLH